MQRWTIGYNVTSLLCGRRALLDMLHDRYMTFLRMPAALRAEIDSERLVPTGEMHDILFHLVATGRFFDETRPLEDEHETWRTVETDRATEPRVIEACG